MDLKKEIEARESYVRSIDLTEGIATSYDNVLGRLTEVADEVLKAAETQDPSDANYRTDTEVIADNLLLEIEANLNLRIGDRFVFAGTRFDEPPVIDMRNLALYDATDIGVANANESDPQIPEFTVQSGGASITQSYHAQFSGAGTNDAASYNQTSVTVNDNQRIDYGITATDPAFQRLIDSVMRMKSAVAQTGLSTDERASLLGEARSQAEQARTDLRQLQSRNGTILNQFERTKELHENFANISQTTLDEIEGADTAEAAVQISTLQSQLQASFTTIARRAQLTLTSFLN